MIDVASDSDVRVHYRICPFCEQNCATEMTVDHANGRVLGVRGDKLDPLSHGFICPKAYAAKDLHHDLLASLPPTCLACANGWSKGAPRAFI